MIVTFLTPICNNNMDIYTGMMAPDVICNSVTAIVKSYMVIDEGDFIRWLGSAKGYRQIELEDKSAWIVRKSNETERYIHIHPAHTGPFTVRFKGSTLKTVYLLINRFKGFQDPLSLEEVNRVRIEAGLSPVKKLDRNKGILKCYEQFFIVT